MLDLYSVFRYIKYKYEYLFGYNTKLCKVIWHPTRYLAKEHDIGKYL